MTATTYVFIFVGLWLAVGLGAAWTMGRHGHDPFTWALLGAFFGPLVIPLAIDARWRAQAAVAPTAYAPGQPGTGPIDVLVGVDGSPEATAALRTALSALGPRIGRLCLAHVSPADDTPATAAAREQGRVALEQATRVVTAAGGPAPDLVLLTGRPSQALGAMASTAGYDLVVVGPRGTGGTRLLLGSTADGLLRSGGVPVLVATPPATLDLRQPARSDDVAGEGQRDSGHAVEQVDDGPHAPVAELDVDQSTVVRPVR